LTDEAIDWPRKESDSDADALSRAERKLINTYVLPLNLKDNFNEDAQASVMAVRRIVDACRAAASIPLGDSDI
jgi:hypothetical protein